jgi:hypothetical protein
MSNIFFMLEECALSYSSDAQQKFDFSSTGTT